MTPITTLLFAALELSRSTFVLNNPHKFASRYLSADRMLQVRVLSAKAEEFKQNRYYDTRYIQRFIMEDKSQEVILSFQLKDQKLGWLVTSMDNPWRIIVDIWPVNEGVKDTPWKWQEDELGSDKKAPPKNLKEEVKAPDPKKESATPPSVKGNTEKIKASDLSEDSSQPSGAPLKAKENQPVKKSSLEDSSANLHRHYLFNNVNKNIDKFELSKHNFYSDRKKRVL